jgi:cell division protein FtsA
MKFLSRFYQTAIDLGSSQLSCWLGQENESKVLSVLGTGHIASRGLWGGQLTDVRALEESLVRILYDTEQQSKVQIRHATLVLNGSFFIFERCVLRASLAHGVVTDGDIQTMVSQLHHPQYHCAQIIPLEFKVDQQENIRDPRGIVGKQLTGHFHGIWMHKGRYDTIISCLKRCQIQVQNILFSGCASALSCLSTDERELGTLLIDLGASTTSASVFLNGLFIDQMTVPIGGHVLTQDIAKAFETSLLHAERLKILHGAALVTQSDHHETIPVPLLNHWDAESTNPIPRSALIRLIQNRSEELLVLLKKQMDACPYSGAVQRIVLTGGGAQLPGLRELVQRMLNRSVRIARPVAPENAPRYTSDLSGVIGGMMYHGLPKDSLLALLKKILISFLGYEKKCDIIVNH